MLKAIYLHNMDIDESKYLYTTSPKKKKNACPLDIHILKMQQTLEAITKKFSIKTSIRPGAYSCLSITYKTVLPMVCSH